MSAVPGNSLIRSNPFVQNDMRIFGGGDRMRVSDSLQPVHLPDDQPEFIRQAMSLSVVSTRTNEQNETGIDYSIISSSSNYGFTNSNAAPTTPAPVIDSNDNEITYGPGIVQRLRAKFTEMSNAAMQNVRISPHSKRKRFPSVDDILSEDERKRDIRTRFRDDKPQLSYPATTKVQLLNEGANQPNDVGILNDISNSTLPAKPIPRSADIQQQQQPIGSLPNDLIAHFQQEEPEMRVPISSLREKFELHSRRPEPRSGAKSTVAALVSNRTPLQFVEDSDEPEFIRVHRRLRRKSERDEFPTAITPTADRSLKIRIISPTQREQRSISKDAATTRPDVLPRLKLSARVVMESSMEEHLKSTDGVLLPVRVSELISPPDPDSARHTLSEPLLSPARFESTERSPPPEEPIPKSVNANEIDNRTYGSLQISSQKITPNDSDSIVLSSPTSLKTPTLSDGISSIQLIKELNIQYRSGLDEMHSLLSKFNVSREQKGILDDDKNSPSNDFTPAPINHSQSVDVIGRPQKIGAQRSFASFDDDTNLPKRRIAEPLIRTERIIHERGSAFEQHGNDFDKWRTQLRPTQKRTESPISVDMVLLSPDAQIHPLDSFRLMSGTDSETKESNHVPDSQPQNQPQVINASASDPVSSSSDRNAKDHAKPLAFRRDVSPHIDDDDDDGFKLSQSLPIVSPQASLKSEFETNETTTTTLNNQTTSATPSSSSSLSSSLYISRDKTSIPLVLPPPPLSSSPPPPPPLPSQPVPAIPVRPSALAITPTHPQNLSAPPAPPQRKAPIAPLPGTDNTQRRSLTAMFLESKKKQDVSSKVVVGSPTKTNDVEAGDHHHQVEQSQSAGNERAEFDGKHEMMSNDSLRLSVPASAPKTDSTAINRSTELHTALENFSKKRITDDTTFGDDCDAPYPTSQAMSQVYSSQLAGDGNPVRYSLINLVSEEDVPMLMEAMAEKLNFVFEDLMSTPSSSNEGIIHDTLKRQQRRKVRNVSRINFKLTPPSVFTYPDESSALEQAEWNAGENITFDQYQKLCESERERCEQQRRDLEKLRASMMATAHAIDANSALSAHPSSPTATDFQLGVTSRISYDSPPIFAAATTNDFTSSNNVSLIAGK